LIFNKNIIANYVGQIYRAVISFIFIPVYISFLGIEAYGWVAIFLILQTWFALLDSGLKPALTREMAKFSSGKYSVSKIHNLLKTVTVITAALGFIVIFLLYFSSDFLLNKWIVYSFNPEINSDNIITLFGVLLALQFIETLYSSCLIGLQLHIRVNICLIFTSSLRAIGAVIVLGNISATINAFFFWQLAASVISTFIFFITLNKSLPKNPSKAVMDISLVKDLKNYILGLMGITFVSLLLTQIDKLIIINNLDISSVAIYSLASSAAAVIFVLVTPITTTYFPIFVAKLKERKRHDLVSEFHRGSQLISVLVIPACLSLSFFGEILAGIWLQNLELSEKVGPLLSLLSIGILVNICYWIPMQLQLAYGWTKLSLYTNLTLSLISIPLYIYAIENDGLIAVAFVSIFIHSLAGLIVFYFMFKKIIRKERWRWFLKDNLFFIALSAFLMFFMDYLFIGETATLFNLSKIFLTYIIIVIINFRLSMFWPIRNY